MNQDEKKTPSPKTQKKLAKMMEAAQARQYDEQEQVLGLRPLVMCGLPLRRLEGPYYRRRSGPYTVELISSPEVGVPYGQDRLIPIFLSTLFAALGCPQDNRVSFLYARDILRLFDLPSDGKTYQRFQEGFARWKRTLIVISHALEEKPKEGKKGRKGEESVSLCLLGQSRLWHQDPQDPSDLPNELWLSPAWADEIRAHPIPVDLQSVRALASCPGALDFYQWQIWRSYSLKEPTTIPLFTPGGLVDQLGCLQEQPRKELRRLLGRWQDQITTVWGDCPNALSADGTAFLLQPAQALRQLEANRFLLSLLRGYRSR